MDIESGKCIAYRISKVLGERNITQKGLAKAINKPDNTFSYWLSGQRTIDLESVIKIAEYLNISTDYILGFQKVPTTNKDVAFVSDYIGLNDISVQEIKKLTASPEYKRIIDFFAYNGSFESGYSDVQRSKLHYICFLFQSMEKELRAQMSLSNDMSNKLSYNEMKNTPTNNPYYKLFWKKDMEITVDLFNLQESIKDFAKEFLGEDYFSVQNFKKLIENNEIDILTQVEHNEWEQQQNKE